MVAFAHVIRAMGGLLFCNMSITNLPKHLDRFIMADWHVSNFTNDSIFSPVREAVVIIYEKFVVKF